MYPSAKCSVPDLQQVVGVWTGAGGTDDCTHDSDDWSKGIASVEYNSSTGHYLITFTEVPGQQIVAHNCRVCVPTTETETRVNVVRSTYDSDAKTVEIEVWDSAATPALVALETDEKLLIDITFAKYAP